MSAETITRIPLKDLRPSPLSPYAVRDDEAMRILTESVRTCGVLTPAIVRPADSGYPYTRRRSSWRPCNRD